MERQTTVHLAGPAYSPEMVEGLMGIATLLEGSGFAVYLATRDSIGSVLSLSGSAQCGCRREQQYRSVLESAGFALEVYQLVHRCDCLVYDMNGRVPDDGGAFLAAVAFAIGRPVVLYKRDHRTKLYGNDNAMLSGLSFDFAPVKEPAKLPGEVTKAIERSGEWRGGPSDLPPLVRLNSDLGRAVWESLQRFQAPDSRMGPVDLYEELQAACEASQAFHLRTTGSEGCCS